ncbi:MAG: TlyA family RNA methyltransferase [Hyphomonadaceae bacterium]|nr:TlyA family RNA methyltransferase [Hyphomonadaceae bacterium]
MSANLENGPRRLDVELVRRGLSASRAAARAAIEAGKVTVGGVAAVKPGQIVSGDTAIEAEPAHPWVSRGGVKLAHALDVFGIDPAGRMCVDIGASTGGFTDVLLSRGARHVACVDVGSAQLNARLRGDPRVTSLEHTDARKLTLDMIGERPSLVVCDLSFISLAKALGPALGLASSEAILIGLFKPQFEVGPARVGKNGIVTDRAATEQAARDFETWLTSAGWSVFGWTPSPIRGGDGNEERLFGARNH